MTARARFVAFGEALTDFIREEDGRFRTVPGGSPWNVARVTATLGMPTGFGGALSRDLFGDALLALARQAGLDLRYLQHIAKSPLLAMVVSMKPVHYFFIGDDSADLGYDPQALPEGWLSEVQNVHFGSISLVRQPLAGRLLSLAEQCHKAGKVVSYDPNLRDVTGAAYRPTLERMARVADYIKLSDEDLAGLFPGDSEAAALKQLHGLAPRASILLTRGAQGMLLQTPGEEVFQPAFKIKLADTVGAGDATMGGWIVSLMTRPEVAPREHVAFAAATAGVVCEHVGAYGPSREEVFALMKRQG